MVSEAEKSYAMETYPDGFTVRPGYECNFCRDNGNPNSERQKRRFFQECRFIIPSKDKRRNRTGNGWVLRCCNALYRGQGGTNWPMGEPNYVEYLNPLQTFLFDIGLEVRNNLQSNIQSLNESPKALARLSQQEYQWIRDNHPEIIKYLQANQNGLNDSNINSLFGTNNGFPGRTGNTYDVNQMGIPFMRGQGGQRDNGALLQNIINGYNQNSNGYSSGQQQPNQLSVPGNPFAPPGFTSTPQHSRIASSMQLGLPQPQSQLFSMMPSNNGQVFNGSNLSSGMGNWQSPQLLMNPTEQFNPNRNFTSSQAASQTSQSPHNDFNGADISNSQHATSRTPQLGTSHSFQRHQLSPSMIPVSSSPVITSAVVKHQEERKHTNASTDSVDQTPPQLPAVNSKSQQTTPQLPPVKSQQREDDHHSERTLEVTPTHVKRHNKPGKQTEREDELSLINQHPSKTINQRTPQKRLITEEEKQTEEPPRLDPKKAKTVPPPYCSERENGTSSNKSTVGSQKSSTQTANPRTKVTNVQREQKQSETTNGRGTTGSKTSTEHVKGGFSTTRHPTPTKDTTDALPHTNPLIMDIDTQAYLCRSVSWKQYCEIRAVEATSVDGVRQVVDDVEYFLVLGRWRLLGDLLSFCSYLELRCEPKRTTRGTGFLFEEMILTIEELWDHLESYFYKFANENYAETDLDMDLDAMVIAIETERAKRLEK